MILPLVMAMAANAVNQFADRVFLSRYSDDAIQGSLPGGILSWLFVCLLVSIAGYSGTFVAQFWGANDRRNAVHAFVQGLWLTLAAIPVIALSIPFGHFVFNICGHAAAVMSAEKVYYDILQIGGIFCVLGTVLSGYFTGIGRTRIVGIANVLGNLANILLDWMFVFGHLGCPSWGIAGAGWATVIAAAIPCVILTAVLLFDPVFKSVRTGPVPKSETGPVPNVLGGPVPRRWSCFSLNYKLLGRIVRYGVPSGLHVFLDVATFAVFVMLTGRLDAMSFAASNVGFAINHLSFAPLMGLSQGAMVLVGQFQGEGDSAAASRSTLSCLFIGYVYVALFVVFVLTCSDFCMDFFHGDHSQFPLADFQQVGHLLMILLSCWAFFDATTLITEGALKGAGDTRYVMYVQTGISFFLWMPLVFAVMKWHPTIGWMWGTMPVYCGTCATLILLRFVYGRWRNIKLVQDFTTIHD